MKKIRIGNDILLRVKLKMPNRTDSINIKSLRAFIINTSKEAEIAKERERKNRFFGRFPMEPMCGCYESTEYVINSCGCPQYHAYPKNYIPRPYCGFGVNPCWENIYKHQIDYKLTQYAAEVRSTAATNVVEVFFPAEEQMYTGKYKLVVVAKIYYPGYRHNNLRTITMDWDDAFELVDSSYEGDTDNPTIDMTDNDVNPDNPNNPNSGQDIYVQGAQLLSTDNDNTADTLRLTRNDGTDINLDITALTGWDEIA